MEYEEQLNKVVKLYRNSDDICVIVNGNVMNTDFIVIWYEHGILYLKFNNDDIKDLKINQSQIKDISFDYQEDMIVSIIKLHNEDKILIHNM